MNLLDQYPEVRKMLYMAQWIVNLGLGIAAIVLTSLGESPQWFVILGAVFNFIWTYTGITAQSNTDTTSAFGEDGAYNAPNWMSAVVLVLVILIFLVVFGVIPGRG